MPDLTAGTTVKGLDTPPTITDTEATSGTTTSTTFVETLTGGTTCAVVFTAPTSGRVLVHSNVRISNSGANEGFAGFVVRTGATPGSGTVVLAAADALAILHNGTTAQRAGISELVSGLTAGDSYNVQQAFRVGAGTGTFRDKTLTVVPTT